MSLLVQNQSHAVLKMEIIWRLMFDLKTITQSCSRHSFYGIQTFKLLLPQAFSLDPSAFTITSIINQSNLLTLRFSAFSQYRTFPQKYRLNIWAFDFISKLNFISQFVDSLLCNHHVNQVETGSQNCNRKVPDSQRFSERLF